MNIGNYNITKAQAAQELRGGVTRASYPKPLQKQGHESDPLRYPGSDSETHSARSFGVWLKELDGSVVNLLPTKILEAHNGEKRGQNTTNP